MDIKLGDSICAISEDKDETCKGFATPFPFSLFINNNTKDEWLFTYISKDERNKCVFNCKMLLIEKCWDLA